MNTFACTEARHCARLVHRAIVGQDPRDAVGSSDLGFHTQHELGPDVAPLSLRLAQETEQSAREVIGDSQQVELGVGMENGPRKSEWKPSAMRVARSKPFERCGCMTHEVQAGRVFGIGKPY